MTGMFRTTFVRAALAALGAGALVIAASGGSAIAQGESVTFEFDGGEAASYTVPAGVCSLEVTALGAAGGDLVGDGFTTPGGLGLGLVARARTATPTAWAPVVTVAPTTRSMRVRACSSRRSRTRAQSSQ